MSRSVEDLCPKVKPKIFHALALIVSRGVHVLITDTLRTEEEQKQLLRAGKSQTLNSKHLPQTKCEACHQLTNSTGTLGMSHALDLAVYSQWSSRGPDKLTWDSTHPDWQTIGECVRASGLRWGGDWKTFKDYAHMEGF